MAEVEASGPVSKDSEAPKDSEESLTPERVREIEFYRMECLKLTDPNKEVYDRQKSAEIFYEFVKAK